VRSTRFRAALAAVLVLSSIGGAAWAHGDEKPAARTLYQRLGGYDAIAAVVDDFVGRLVTDPQLARFFSGHGTDSKARIRQHVIDQLCQATGGPCVYTGRSMKVAHGGLKITEADWDTAVKHLGATFDRFAVPAQERGEVVAAIGAMKGDIVEGAGEKLTKK
jgi:hemoglobin